MTQRKLYFLVLVLLLISVGIVVAQSSNNFTLERFVTMSGGTADSTNYKVDSVIGQPATDVVVSSSYKVSGGFLYPTGPGSGTVRKVWLPVISN